MRMQVCQDSSTSTTSPGLSSCDDYPMKDNSNELSSASPCSKGNQIYFLTLCSCVKIGAGFDETIHVL